MSLAGRDIAVVGAGIGGLAVATALAQRRAHVRLYEQAPALAEVGAGLQVAPNGVAVLEALGLRDAAGELASLPEAVELRDHHGRPIARLPLGQTCVARYGRPYWHLHRADLLRVLASGAAAAGVEIHLGTRIAEVVPEATGLRLQGAGGAETAAEIVVAADGVRSDLRAAHLTAAPARFTGHVAWRGLAPAELLPERPPARLARVTMGPGRHLVSYPLRGGRLLNFVAVEERAAWTAEGWTAPDDPENMRRAFAGWADAEALLAAVERCFLWGLFDHAPLPRWTAGRLVLLGDACHPMLPFLAQGATMALEDAWVLAHALDRAPDLDRGLAAYEAARLPRATRVQRAAARSGRLYHLRPGARAMVHAGLGLVSALAPGLLAGRFDWLFGKDVTAA